MSIYSPNLASMFPLIWSFHFPTHASNSLVLPLSSTPRHQLWINQNPLAQNPRSLVWSHSGFQLMPHY